MIQDPGKFCNEKTHETLENLDDFKHWLDKLAKKIIKKNKYKDPVSDSIHLRFWKETENILMSIPMCLCFPYLCSSSTHG